MTKKTQSQRIRDYIAQHPRASNAELYARFPRYPKPSIRRVANSQPSIRRAKHLPPLAPKVRAEKPHEPQYFRHRLAFAPKLDIEKRFDRLQFSYERSLRFEEIKIPLNADVVDLLERIFADADDMEKWLGFNGKLRTYILDCEIARGGSFGPRGTILPDWSGEFISVTNPNGLQASAFRELWIPFAEYAITKIDNVERGRVIVAAEIVSASNSDPVFLRPARLRLFSHA